MKISKHTDQILILEYRPILFAAIFGSVSFATFAWGVLEFEKDGLIKILVSSLFILALLALVERARLILNAAEGYAELVKKSTFGTKHLRFEMSEVSHFEVEEFEDSDGADAERMIMVVTGEHAKGRYTLTDTSYTASLDEVTQKTNEWLYRQQGRPDPSSL